MPKIALFFNLIWSAIFLGTSNADNSSSLPVYQPIDDKELIQGVLSSSGSTTLSPVLKEWLQDFTSIYPSVTFLIQSDGSGFAPKALLSGEANLGAMSRKIKDEEIRSFKALKLYQPYELKVALDALGVIVNLQNPVNSISVPQLDAIYSKSRLCGHPTPVAMWRDLGWDISNQIEAHHIDEKSGGHGFFRKVSLCQGNYRKSLLPIQQNSLQMLAATKASRFTLGFASMSVINRSVKTLKISRSGKFPLILPNPTNISKGLYPFTRYLYLYLDKHPDSDLEPHIAEFIKYIYSRQGQKTALLKGSFPLSTVDISKQLDVLKKHH